MDGEQSDLLNVRETARRLGVHENTVRNWARSGVLSDSRVPGSRFHRFRPEDVERLLAQRGAAVPSLQMERRTVSPELVSANQLKQWPAARARDAQENFPELIRRLLVETPGITSISMRSGDGVALPGFDGVAEAEKTAFLPSGYLAFELGVDRDPLRKATSDYDNRITMGRSNRAFVFATPRRWPGKEAWADERRKQTFFRDVQVLDADDLEGWLRTSPAAHYWISEHLGLRPRDAQTLDDWWARFSASTAPALPAALFIAGRAIPSEQLSNHLDGAPKLVVVESEWTSDCLAFLYGSRHDEEGQPSAEARSAVIVSAPEVWDRILEQPGRAVLIPDFDDANVGAALDRGHHVISVVDRTTVSRRGVDIQLPRLDRRAAAEALESAGIDFRTADRLAALGRRSLPALARQLSRNPRFSRPEWATGADAPLLAPLVLIGSWTTTPQDVAAVERLVGIGPEVIEQTARRLSRTTDPVLRKVGQTWMFTSPEEAFLLLRDSLGDGAIERWRSELKNVLMEPNPLMGMSSEERLTAQMRNEHERCSATLRRGLAQGLALMGAMGADTTLDDGSTLADIASQVVRSLLRAANDDESGRDWELLAPTLPLLAEAGPVEFLLALEDGLTGGEPSVLRLFREDQESGLSLGPTSPHPPLLWAIETVTWSEQFLIEGVRALARLADMEPGGKSGNRPASSLASILCGWVRHTGASLDTRLQALDVAYEVSPAVGWKLIFDLWPSNRGWVMPPAAPHVRDDWRPTVTSLSMADWAAFVQGLVERALRHAGVEPARLRKLVTGLTTVSPDDRERILGFVEALARDGGLDADTRLEVWEKLQSVVARHERFATAAWALPPEVVARLKALAGQLEPDSDPQRFAYLFDWHPDLPGVEQRNFEVYSARLTELRDKALTHVLAAPDWADQLTNLSARTKVPGQLGSALASQEGVDLAEIIRWLHEGSGALFEVAINYVHRRMMIAGAEWLTTFLASPELIGDARRAVLRQVPAEASNWQVLRESPVPTDVDVYWTTAPIEVVQLADAMVAIDTLVSHGRAWSAIAVASYALDMAEREREAQPSLAIKETDLIALLDHALKQEPLDGEITQMTGYYLGELLDYLTAKGAPQGAIARFEFAYFRLLEHQRDPVVLNQALATQPELFVDLVKRVFWGKSEPRRKKPNDKEDLATQAWWVLQGWDGFPGRRDDGSLDESVMQEWITAARLELSDVDRADIGDEVIGQAFAHSPVGSDDVWPAEVVRDLMETIGSREFENGLIIGRLNSRGVTTRGVYDGGKQERDLAEQYREWSTSTKGRWPRTSRILRSIAESYERDAKREDLQAELGADQP